MAGDAAPAPAPSPAAPAPPFPYEFDPERRKKARVYGRGSRIISILGWTAFPLALAAALLFTGASRALADLASSLAGGPGGVADALYIVLFSVIFAGATFPVGFYSGYLRERRWQMTRRSFRSFLADSAKGVGLALVFALILLPPFFYIVRRFGNWWLIVAALYAAFLLIRTTILPHLLLPLFYKVEPLSNEPLRATLLEVAERVGLRGLSHVVVMDESAKSVRANAFIHGVGAARRIVLFDTLLRNFHPREVRFVVAHETAHLARHHVPKSTGAALALVFPEVFLLSLILDAGVGQFGITAAGDVAALPLLLLFVVLYSLIDSIPLSWLSRRHEAEADRIALDATRDGPAAESMMKRMCDLNLIDDAPHPILERLFYSHPPPRERIERARAFAARSPAEEGASSPW